MSSMRYVSHLELQCADGSRIERLSRHIRRWQVGEVIEHRDHGTPPRRFRIASSTTVKVGQRGASPRQRCLLQMTVAMEVTPQ